MDRRDLRYYLNAGFSFFFLYLGYELVRGSSGVILQNSLGTRGFMLATAFSPLGTMAALVGYDAVLTRRGARYAFRATALASIVLLALGWAALVAGLPGAAIAVFLVREAYVVLITEQIWSLLNSQLRKPEAEKWYGPFTGVGSIGAILGGLLVVAVAQRVVPEHFMLMAAILLVGCYFCTDDLYRLRPEPKKSPGAAKDVLGLRELFREKTLGRLLVIVCAGQTVATLAGVEFHSQLQIARPNVADQTEYTGYFAMVLNALCLVLQFAFTPVVLGRVASGWILLAIPVILAGFVGGVVIWPSLASAAALMLAHKSIDYSVFRASKEVLYMPLSYEARFRSKELIDVLGYRATKGLSSGAAWAVELALGASLFLRPAIMFIACLGWLYCARGVLRDARADESETPKKVA